MFQTIVYDSSHLMLSRVMLMLLLWLSDVPLGYIVGRCYERVEVLIFAS